MAQHKRTEVVDFVAGLLKKNPTMSYPDLVKISKKSGYHVYPLIVGLARKSLGQVSPRPARTAKPVRRSVSATIRSNGASHAHDLVKSVARLHEDAQGARAALREIAKLAAKF